MSQTRRTRMWCSKSLTLALAFALACQSCLAQGQAIPGDWTQVQALAIGTTISVRTRAGAKCQGELVGVTPDSIAIDSDEPTFAGRRVHHREFKRENIREIRLLKPVTSVLAGAGIGAGIGAAVGISIDAGAKVNGYRVPLALLITGLGAVVGAALAHHDPFIKGNKIYAAP
jgi:hypothetical protein